MIFVFATLFGFASHAPGSLGVFDAAMLVGLGQFNREDLVAGLLLFRLIYFIIPFALALLIDGRPRAVAGDLARPAGCAPGALAIDVWSRYFCGRLVDSRLGVVSIEAWSAVRVVLEPATTQ